MVKVTSARQLASQVKDRILKMFSGRQVEFVVDKTMLGGIKIDTGDQVFDATIASAISDLQQHLVNTYAE